jgi:hypothetical protein
VQTEAGQAVENLLMEGAFPVDESTAKFFFRTHLRKMPRAALCVRFRHPLRLIAVYISVESMTP